MLQERDIAIVAKRRPARPSPHMIIIKGRDRKFYILIEQIVLCEAASFSQGLFLLLSSYFVFHLKYPDKCKKVLLFLQDYVLGQPDNFKPRKGTYLAISSDIKKCLHVD